jgi:hypothetical protein
VVIIISYYFPFYEYLPSNKSRPDPNFMAVLALGFNCWQANSVSPIRLDSEEVPLRLRGQIAFIFEAKCDINKETQYPHQLIRGLGGLAPQTLGRWQCTCNRWALTGKQCKHLWASGILNDHGPVNLLEAASDLAREAARKKEEEDEEDNTDAEGDEDDEDDDDDEDGDSDSGPDRPGDNAPLGRQEEAEPEEDGVDLAGFWGTNVLAQGSLVGIETINGVQRDTNAPKTAKPAWKTEPKPIIQPRGSGNDSDSMSNGSAAEDAYSAKHSKGTQSRSGNPPGPSPGIQPLNPRRTQPTSSSLSLSRGDRDLLLKPGGIKNTGDDCYAASILQVLANQPEWTAAYDSAYSSIQTLSSSVLGHCVNDVMSSLSTRRTKSYPLLNKAFAEAIGQDAGQHDPAEVLRGLFAFLNTLIPDNAAEGPRSPFPNVFGVSVMQQFTCQGCSQVSTVDQNGSPEYSEVILQASPGNRLLTVHQMIASTMSLRDSVGTRQCLNPECRQDVWGGLDVSLKTHGQLLAVEVASPPDIESRQGIFSRDFRSFDLKTDLIFGEDTWATLGSAGKIAWQLRGIICHQGSSPNSGHYTAMLLRGTNWWEADDSRVRRVKSILECFEGLQTPRLLVYQRKKQSSKEAFKAKRSRPTSESSMDESTAPNKAKSKKTATKKQGRTKDTGNENNTNGKQTWPNDIDDDNNGTWPGISPILYNMNPSTLPICDKPANFGTVPPFKLSKSGGQEAWLERYATIVWPLRKKRSFLKTSLGIKRPVDPAQFQDLSHTLPAQSVMDAADLHLLLKPATWVSTPMIHRTVDSLVKLRQAVGTQRNRGQISTYAQEFVKWSLAPGSSREHEPILCSLANGPAPAFAGHPDWRAKRTVTYFNISPNQHWIAVIIFGPERLLVPYDSLAGAVVHPTIQKVSSSQPTRSVS